LVTTTIGLLFDGRSSVVRHRFKRELNGVKWKSNGSCNHRFG